MAWNDRLESLWETGDRTYPLEFHEGWARRENAGRNGPPRSSQGEATWYQIDPREARSIGVDLDVAEKDERAAFEAGVKLMHYYDAKTPPAFTGTARLWIIKSWHTLNLLAKRVIDGMPDGADDWHDVSVWATSNITPALLVGADGVKHNPGKWIRLTDDVMADVSDESLPVVEQAAELGDKIGEAFGTEEGGVVAVVLGGVLVLGALGAILWRLL